MKTFKGIISNWKQDSVYSNDADFVITGRCLFHLDYPEWEGEIIHTSTVILLTKLSEDYYSCETRNSFYILINKASL